MDVFTLTKSRVSTSYISFVSVLRLLVMLNGAAEKDGMEIPELSPSSVTKCKSGLPPLLLL